MKFTKTHLGWVALLGIFALLGLYGCGGSSSSATKATATGNLSTTNGTTASQVAVTAPSGVSLAIPAATTLLDGSGAPVTGSIATSVSYSTTPADLPAAAQTLPAGTTLAAFADISMGSVKTFSSPVALAISVPAAVAQPGDLLAVYSFDSGTGVWTSAGTYAVDSNGAVSPQVTHLSIWAVFKTATTPPAKPANLTVTPGNGQVTLTWDSVTDATSYNVYYGAGATSLSTKVTGAVSGQAITGLTNGGGYYFAVTAVNAGVESVHSTVASTVLAPAAPTAVTPVGGSGQASLTWAASTGATSYNIYYGTSPGVTAASTSKVVGAVNGQAVTGLTAGSSYYFVVTAVNVSGESPVSAESSVLLAPAAPKGIVVSPGDGQATITWTVATGATSYNIYYDTGSITAASPKLNTAGTVLSATQLDATVTGLQNGIVYNFAVTALDAGGESPVSAIKQGTPNPTSAPGSPTGVTVTQGGAGQAQVSWGTVSGASSYRVYYLQTGTSTAPSSTQVLAGAAYVTSSGTSTTVALPSGSSYWWFAVTALNAAGESGTQNSPKPNGGLTIP
ncbi:fibronectin type III domain-containing protein [Geomesophilobacter sediminis]|uniref:Fibronectin type III domain-containing protein n=1 Tax=Geomesophilobacter sediminis TaxID=2798584 RepID=A0A8J7IYL8_9BACT|nr:fibronectin type III domain-containing protein [Geomesophilobacter sediminis]MBJ6725297.1 fibronectin type III domain-containing protein [Geomesophilobacter sediminis]